MSRVTLMVAMGFVLGLAAAAQGAVTLFECGFETTQGYTAGVALGGQQGWTFTGGTPDLTVSTLRFLGGSQAARWDHTGSFQGWNFYYHEFALKSNGTLTVEFWMRLEDSGGTGLSDTQNLILRTGDQQGASGSWGREYFQIPALNATDVTTYSPNYYRHNCENPGGATTSELYKPGITDDDEWKGIRIVTHLDTTPSTIDVYGKSQSDPNWTQMAAGLDADYPNASGDGHDIGSVAFYSLGPWSGSGGYQGTEDVYIDDVLVTWEPPEPPLTLPWFCGFEASEGYTAGAPLGGQQDWIAENGSPATDDVTVSTNRSLGGSQAARWDHTGTFAGWDFYTHEFPLTSNGTLIVEFWMRLEDSGGTSLTNTQGLVLRTGDRQGASGDEREYFLIPAHSIADVLAKSPDYYRHNAEWGNVPTSDLYKPGITDDDEWKGIRIATHLDTPRSTIDVYGKSQSDPDWTAMATGLTADYPNAGEGHDIGSITFYSIGAYSASLGYGGTKDVYIDNISVYFPPAGEGTVILVE